MLAARYGDEEISQFRGAELIAEKWNCSREEMEQFALSSHTRALSAIRAGHFDNEIVPVGDFRIDEGPRDTTLENGGPEDAGRGRPVDRRAGQPDLRRCQRGAAGLPGGQRPQPDAAGPHSPHQRPRRRPGVHADRPIRPLAMRWKRPGSLSKTSTPSRSMRRSHRSCWRGSRRSRPTRKGSIRTAARSRSGIRSEPRARACSRHCCAGARAKRWPLRAADDVRGRWHGQHDGHRAALAPVPCAERESGDATRGLRLK